MGLDRMDVRRAVGEAVKRINADQEQAIAEIHEESSRLHKRWRDLVDQAHEAHRAYELCKPRFDIHDELLLLAKLKHEHPDLRFLDEEMTPHLCPVVCDVSGLGIFEDDEIYGEPEYGTVILKDAVVLSVDQVESISHDTQRAQRSPNDVSKGVNKKDLEVEDVDG